MQFKEPYDAVLGSRSKIKVLRFFCSHPEEITGRELGRRIGLSHLKVHQVLKEFHQHGLVKMRKIGSAMLYCLKEDNILIRDIVRILFKSEHDPLIKLTEVITKRLRVFVESIILFGKITYDGKSPNTEIEVLLVIRDDMNLRAVEKGAQDTADEISNIFGNRFVPLIWNMTELCGRFLENDDLHHHIQKTGRVIYGCSLPELVQRNANLDFRR